MASRIRTAFGDLHSLSGDDWVFLFKELNGNAWTESEYDELLTSMGSDRKSHLQVDDLLRLLYGTDESSPPAPPSMSVELMRQKSCEVRGWTAGARRPWEADEQVPPQPDLVRGFTGAPKADLSAQKRLVASVLPGWTGIDIDLIEIEDKSGHGGSRTFKVFAEDAEPPAVALHSRATVREDTTEHHAYVDQLTEDRQEAAARAFSTAGVAPRRLAQGGDWFIEPWEGEQPWNQEGCTWNTVEHLQVAAELMARVHRDVPVSWYDEWRPKIIERIPAMSEASLGSHAWQATSRMQWFEGEGAHLQDVIRYYVTAGTAPEFPLAARIVTLHGDFHPGNYIQTKEDGLLCVDLECSHVGYAVGDVAYALYWMPQDRHRLFIEAYMKASGIPKPSSEEIDAFYFEAELCRMRFFHPAILFHDFHRSKDDPTYDFRRYRLVDDLEKRARAELTFRSQIIEKGFTQIHKSMEVEMAVEKGKDFSNYERLVSDGKIDQCWCVKTGEGEYCVQVNLADRNYARFTFDGSHCLGQGQFTMQQGIYAESSREDAKGELRGNQADFHIMLDNDHYVPVAENVFPWALPLTRVELNQDLFLGHFDELSANGNVDQLWYIKQTAKREPFFQYNFANRNFVFINVMADCVLDKNTFVWHSGVYTEPAEPHMRGDMKGDASNFHVVFDGEPHGYHEFIPVRWNLVEWAGSNVQEAIMKANSS